MTHASKTVLTLASLLVVVAVFNLVVVSETYSGITSKTDKAAADLAENSRPAEISITTIGVENCADCFDTSKIISSIKSAGVKVVNEKTVDYASGEAQQLIKKYDIQKAPAIILSGEINKSNVKAALSAVGSLVDGAIVFSSPGPVYINLSTGDAVGRVNATIISADSCKECKNLSAMVLSLRSGGIKLSSVNVYDYKSSEGKALISKYSITAVPAVMFSKGFELYAASMPEESDGTIVIRTLFPPYINLSTNKVRGAVSLTSITDTSCSACYNVSFHKAALLSLGVSPSDETTYDVSSAEGRALISKYSIMRVPTILLSSEASAYAQLVESWKSVGTIESDGVFVFNATELMGTYKDLAANKIVTPASGR